MKKHLSVFMLMARSTIYKALFLFSCMGIVQGMLFALVLKRDMQNHIFSLEATIKHSHIVWVFVLVFFLLIILLASTGFETSSKQRYTLKRLSISENWTFIWKSIYNIICLTIFWMTEILILLLLSHYFISVIPTEFTTNQTVFLGFYRSNLLHSVLPFDAWLLWARNIVLMIVFGIGTAYISYVPGKEKKGGTQDET